MFCLIVIFIWVPDGLRSRFIPLTGTVHLKRCGLTIRLLTPKLPRAFVGKRTGVSDMLVVTANWAIGDGTLWRRPLRGLVSRAWGVIQRSALRAGFRHDGRYQAT